MSAALLETHSLTASIGGKAVCRGLDLALQPGSVLGVLGPNGVGKTTLLHTLAGLRPADSGRIEIEGAPLAAQPRRWVAQRLGLLMQQYHDPFPATVLETVLIGRHPHMDFWRWESHADVTVARRALRTVGLEGFEQRAQHTLSGGERRRLAIATILAQSPAIYLLDEPANHLDLKHQIELLSVFGELARRERRAVMMTLHDINVAARYCDRVMLMFGAGETLSGTTGDVLNETNLSRLYGTPVRRLGTEDGDIFLPA